MALAKLTVDAIEELARDAITSGASDVRAFYRRHWLTFGRALTRLATDPAVSNRSREELNFDLFALVSDLLRERETYTEHRALALRLETFVTAAVHTSVTYEVAFPIEALTLPDGEIAIGRTTFAHFDDVRLSAWVGNLEKDSMVRHDLIDRTVGVVRVAAGSPERASELAGLEVDTSLALLRAAMAFSRAFAPMDGLFWQRRARFRVVKQLADPPVLHWEIRNELTGVELDLRTALRDRAERLTTAGTRMGRQVAPLFDGTISKRVADSLIRAGEWIGSSVTRESYDDKVVDLCAALECMLATKDDKRKGEAIAFRHVLLSLAVGGLIERPFATLGLYELRSDIVHGAKRRVATEWDYALLREITMAAFTNALRFVAANRDLKHMKALIERLESDKLCVELAVDQFESGHVKSNQCVAEFGRAVLARVCASPSPGE